MPLQPLILLRDKEVVALGKATRLKYADMSIEEVARSESIILEIATYHELKRGGISVCQPIETFHVFESLVDDELCIESRYPVAKGAIKLIALAHDYIRNGEHIQLEEIFWHEYYHMNWSPELPPYDPEEHEYSTHGVLDKQDEARADLFAASVMIDRIEDWDNALSISLRCSISKRLAALALDIERRKGLFSREWKAEYV